MKTTVGNLGWIYVKLKEDTPVSTFIGENSATLPKDTLIRYYEGTSDVFVAGGKKKLVSPAPDGTYLIETVPDAQSRFWLVYPASDVRYVNLVESKEYADTASERDKHLFITKLPVKEPWWQNQIVDNVLHLQLNDLGLPPPSPSEGNSGGGTKGEDEGFPWLAVGLGVGLALLIAMLMGEDKAKGKRARREG